MKQRIQFVSFYTTYGILYLISLLPMSLLYGIASFHSFLAYRIVGYRKVVVVMNIARAFPEKKYKEIEQIVKTFYGNFFANFAEVVKYLSSSPESMEKKITFENLELIDEYTAKGQNIIACLGHCANWEMLNYMPSKLSCDMYAVYKPLRSATMDQLMIKIRSRFGMKLIPDKSVARHLLKQDTAPGVYLFLADQRPRTRDEKYHYLFMNQPTYLFSGMEKLARIGKSAVIYLHIVQESRGHYRVKCLPLASNAKEMEEGTVTQRYIDLLTQNIQEAPSGWLWTHKRWSH